MEFQLPLLDSPAVCVGGGHINVNGLEQDQYLYIKTFNG